MVNRGAYIIELYVIRFKHTHKQKYLSLDLF